MIRVWVLGAAPVREGVGGPPSAPSLGRREGSSPRAGVLAVPIALVVLFYQWAMRRPAIRYWLRW